MSHTSYVKSRIRLHIRIYTYIGVLYVYANSVRLSHLEAEWSVGKNTGQSIKITLRNHIYTYLILCGTRTDPDYSTLHWAAPESVNSVTAIGRPRILLLKTDIISYKINIKEIVLIFWGSLRLTGEVQWWRAFILIKLPVLYFIYYRPWTVCEWWPIYRQSEVRTWAWATAPRRYTFRIPLPK